MVDTHSQWPDPQGFWAQRRVCVTGGAGFLGSFVVEKLREWGAEHIFVPRQKEYDLTELEAIRQLLADARPDVIIHRAVLPEVWHTMRLRGNDST